MKSKTKNIQPFSFLKTKNYQLETRGGFTLVEMIVSIALFSFIMLGVTAVLLSVVDADHKAQGLKSVMNNMSLTLESIARNLRMGKSYQCGGPGGHDCARPPFGPLSILTFTDHTGGLTTYCLVSGVIRISTGANDCRDTNLSSPMTAPEILVDRLDFYVSGTLSNDGLQPEALIVVGGVVNPNTTTGAKARTTSRFDIETLVSQRFVDVPQN